jgi:hypothetical protein
MLLRSPSRELTTFVETLTADLGRPERRTAMTQYITGLSPVVVVWGNVHEHEISDQVCWTKRSPSGIQMKMLYAFSASSVAHMNSRRCAMTLNVWRNRSGAAVAMGYDRDVAVVVTLLGQQPAMLVGRFARMDEIIVFESPQPVRIRSPGAQRCGWP